MKRPVLLIVLLLGSGLEGAQDRKPAGPSTDSRPADIAQRVEKGHLALIRMHAKSLESPLWVRRCFGVQALSDVRHPQAVDRLIDALEDEDNRVLAMTLLELLVRADEVLPVAADALGRAVKQVAGEQALPLGTYLALLAAERLPVAPEAYRAIWKRTYARLRNLRTQSELATALVNVIRARADGELIDEIILEARGASRSEQDRAAQFLRGLFGTTPGIYGTWPRWWAMRRQSFEFADAVPTAFSEAVDRYIDARRQRKDPKHGTREYFQQFEVFLGKLYASGLDVVFVFDSTGSMQPFIDEAKENIRVMTDLLGSITQETRVGLVTYRDRGDAYVTLQIPLTDKADRLRTWLDNVEAHGGGDAPEAILAAVKSALERFDWRNEAKRLITVIGDAPPHKEDRPQLHEICRQAAKDGFVINTIALVPTSFSNGSSAKGGKDRLTTRDLQALATTLTFEEVARYGGGRAVVQSDMAEVIADMLKMSFGSEWKEEVNRFVEAYLLIALAEPSLKKAHKRRVLRSRILERLRGGM